MSTLTKPAILVGPCYRATHKTLVLHLSIVHATSTVRTSWGSFSTPASYFRMTIFKGDGGCTSALEMVFGGCDVVVAGCGIAIEILIGVHGRDAQIGHLYDRRTQCDFHTRRGFNHDRGSIRNTNSIVPSQHRVLKSAFTRMHPLSLHLNKSKWKL